MFVVSLQYTSQELHITAAGQHYAQTNGCVYLGIAVIEHIEPIVELLAPCWPRLGVLQTLQQETLRSSE